MAFVFLLRLAVSQRAAVTEPAHSWKIPINPGTSCTSLPTYAPNQTWFGKNLYIVTTGNVSIQIPKDLVNKTRTVVSQQAQARTYRMPPDLCRKDDPH